MPNESLVFPMPEHSVLWQNIIAEFVNAGEQVVPYGLKLGCDTYTEFLQKIKDSALIRGVPTTTYFLMNETQNKILGAVNIRHYLNKALLENGGHIGYGIAPSERRKGYATKILELALLKCREIGVEKALVTCDKTNVLSAKTILNNGGVLENEVVEDNGNILQRYWIDLSNGGL